MRAPLRHTPRALALACVAAAACRYQVQFIEAGASSDASDALDVVREEVAVPPDVAERPCPLGRLPDRVPSGTRMLSIISSINNGTGTTGLVYAEDGALFVAGTSAEREPVGERFSTPAPSPGSTHTHFFAGFAPAATGASWVRFFVGSVGTEEPRVATALVRGEQLVFAVGAYRGTLTVEASTVRAGSTRAEGYLARMLADGTVRQLVALPGEAGRDLTPVGVATASDGTFCIAANERVRDAGTPPRDTASRAWIRCERPDGMARTVRLGRATDQLYVRRIAVASDGELVLGGSFRGQAMLGAQTLTATASSGTTPDDDLWLARVRADDTVRWARSLGGASPDRVESITAGCGGDAWVALSHTGKVRAHARAFTPSDSWDALALRVAPDGADRWAYRLANREADIVNTLVVDANQHAVFAGNVNAVEAMIPAPNGSSRYGDPRDLYALALDEAGDPRWSRAWRADESRFSADSITAMALRRDTLAITGESLTGVTFGSMTTPIGWFVAELR